MAKFKFLIPCVEVGGTHVGKNKTLWMYDFNFKITF